MITLTSDADERAADAMAVHIAFLLKVRFGIASNMANQVYKLASGRVRETVDTGLPLEVIMHLYVVQVTLERVFDRTDAEQIVTEFKARLSEPPLITNPDLVLHDEPFSIALHLAGLQDADETQMAEWDERYEKSVRRPWLSVWDPTEPDPTGDPSPI